MLCECGCGLVTPKYDRSNGKYRKGEHARYVWGHHMRAKNGERIRHRTKLTVREVLSIKAKLAKGRQTRRQIGGFYGVSEECIRDISTGKTWSDVQLVV